MKKLSQNNIFCPHSAVRRRTGETIIPNCQKLKTERLKNISICFQLGSSVARQLEVSLSSRHEHMEPWYRWIKDRRFSTEYYLSRFQHFNKGKSLIIYWEISISWSSAKISGCDRNQLCWQVWSESKCLSQCLHFLCNLKWEFVNHN